MLAQELLIAGGALVLAAIACVALVRRGQRWGSTAEERDLELPGDEWFPPAPRAFVAMTRAVSIDASPETVWPWLEQLGRGAGWYSYDWLDNGGRESAMHIVSWIPPARLGDASPIGYLRHLEPGLGLTWWAPGTPFLGANTHLAADFRLSPEREGSRLMIRMSGSATGRTSLLAIGVFRVIDSIMAIRMLRELRKRVEAHGARTCNPAAPETGARDQYQLWEAVLASGERVGQRGKERGEYWHRAAQDAGVIENGAEPTVGPAP